MPTQSKTISNHLTAGHQAFAPTSPYEQIHFRHQCLPLCHVHTHSGISQLEKKHPAGPVSLLSCSLASPLPFTAKLLGRLPSTASNFIPFLQGASIPTLPTQLLSRSPRHQPRQIPKSMHTHCPTTCAPALHVPHGPTPLSPFLGPRSRRVEGSQPALALSNPHPFPWSQFPHMRRTTMSHPCPKGSTGFQTFVSTCLLAFPDT